MLRVLTWPSNETSKTLIPVEIDALFEFTYQVAQPGELGNGYIGASRPLYWERMKGSN